MTNRRPSHKPPRRGQVYSPDELLLAAERTEREAHRIMATALALRDVYRRYNCQGCTPTIEIPIDHDGGLMTSYAYAMHELTCTMQ